MAEQTARYWEEKLQGLTDEIAKLKQERIRVLDQWARERCPLGIGDHVRCCNGHTGKYMQIDRVTAAGYEDHKTGKFVWEWLVEGHLLRLDGQVGRNRAGFREHHWREYGCPLPEVEELEEADELSEDGSE